MTSLIRRLTKREKDKPPPITVDTGETLNKAIDNLTKATEETMNQDTALNIAKRLESIWNCVFDIDNEVAPQRKFALAEALVNRPEVIRKLMIVFLTSEIDIKQKIRDVLFLLETWSSNDAPESSVPRSHRNHSSKPPAKLSQVLFRCRFELYHVIEEGRDGPDSVRLYNDVIGIFARDPTCLQLIFKDEGLNDHGHRVRDEGCVWKVFQRLLEVEGPRGFHLYTGFYETVEILFSANQAIVHSFIMNNMGRFKQTMYKLISLNNFIIQAKSLQFLYRILTCSLNSHIRIRWMSDSVLLKSICLSIQSQHNCVRKEAFVLLNLFIQNPDNTPDVDRFFRMNREKFLFYCMDNNKMDLINGVPLEDDRRTVLDEITSTLMSLNRRPDDEPCTSRAAEAVTLEEQRRRAMEIPIIDRQIDKNKPEKQKLLGTPIKFGKPKRR